MIDGTSQLLTHVAGDYVVQTDHQAVMKTQEHGAAALHAATYTACFLPLTRNPRALVVIGASHFIIDRWRLARYVCWAKNQLAPAEWRHPWNAHTQGTGYHTDAWPTGPNNPPMENCVRQSKPSYMAVWLMIVVDNFLHVCINRWALKKWSRSETS